MNINSLLRLVWWLKLKIDTLKFKTQAKNYNFSVVLIKEILLNNKNILVPIRVMRDQRFSNSSWNAFLLDS